MIHRRLAVVGKLVPASLSSEARSVLDSSQVVHELGSGILLVLTDSPRAEVVALDVLSLTRLTGALADGASSLLPLWIGPLPPAAAAGAADPARRRWGKGEQACWVASGRACRGPRDEALAGEWTGLAAGAAATAAAAGGGEGAAPSAERGESDASADAGSGWDNIVGVRHEVAGPGLASSSGGGEGAAEGVVLLLNRPRRARGRGRDAGLPSAGAQQQGAATGSGNAGAGGGLVASAIAAHLQRCGHVIRGCTPCHAGMHNCTSVS